MLSDVHIFEDLCLAKRYWKSFYDYLVFRKKEKYKVSIRTETVSYSFFILLSQFLFWMNNRSKCTKC